MGVGGLDWIDLGRVQDVMTGVGQSRVNTASVVSVGRRLDGSAEKFLGLRPDFNQTGTEQMEWSFEAAEFDGKDGKVQPANIAVWRHRQRCRMLIAPAKDCREFRIIFRLHLTGLRVVEQYGEFWLFSTIDGGFRFRIREPAVCDPKTQEPVRDRDYEPIRGLVRHSLVKDGDSYLYVKDSTEEFAKAVTDGLLPAGFLVDADTYYSTTADGYVTNQNNDWATCRAGTSGWYTSTTVSNNASFVEARISGSTYYITRSFLYFSTDAVVFPDSASLYIYGYVFDGSTMDAQKGTQQDSLTTVDFDSLTGASYGTSGAWSTAGYNGINFNATGVSDINISGTTKVCCRESAKDVADSAPVGSYQVGGYYSDQTGTDKDPYLSITEAVAGGYTPQVMIFG